MPKDKRISVRVDNEVVEELEWIKQNYGLTPSFMLSNALNTILCNRGNPDSEYIKTMKKRMEPHEEVVKVWKPKVF